MSDDHRLAESLRGTRAPDEDAAEERAWELVQAAYAEREPIPRPANRARRVALALAGGAAVVAIGLSPAGAEVGDFVSDVIGINDEDAKPALRSLPAAGELLVETEQGPWIVRADGSKRLLGAYDQATWSQPRGLNVAVTDGRELIAVDPAGAVQWTISAQAPVRDPRWSTSGYRIAYRTGGDLWVVAGDGTGAARVARDVAPVAPAWRPIDPESKLAAVPNSPGSHVLSYVTAAGEIRTIDTDSGDSLPTTQRDLELLTAPAAGGPKEVARSPQGESTALIRTHGEREELVLLRDGVPRARVIFAAPGDLTGPTWSPDGEWLLVGWREADQWVFINPERPQRLIAIDRISEQFDPGDGNEADFPRPVGWILPQR